MIKRKKSARQKFTKEEDDKIRDLIENNGIKNWNQIAKELPNRSPRQCRDRWNNYLSNSPNKIEWTEKEDKIITSLIQVYGTKYVKIAGFLPGKTGVNIKNRWFQLQRQWVKENKKKNKFLMNETFQTLFFGKKKNKVDLELFFRMLNIRPSSYDQIIDFIDQPMSTNSHLKNIIKNNQTKKSSSELNAFPHLNNQYINQIKLENQQSIQLSAEINENGKKNPKPLSDNSKKNQEEQVVFDKNNLPELLDDYLFFEDQ